MKYELILSSGNAGLDIVQKAILGVRYQNTLFIGNDTDLLSPAMHHFTNMDISQHKRYVLVCAPFFIKHIFRYRKNEWPKYIANNILCLHTASGCDTTYS